MAAHRLIVLPSVKDNSTGGRLHGIQRHVELQHIDMGLADDAEKPVLDMVANQFFNRLRVQMARLGHPRRLNQGPPPG